MIEFFRIKTLIVLLSLRVLRTRNIFISSKRGRPQVNSESKVRPSSHLAGSNITCDKTAGVPKTAINHR